MKKPTRRSASPVGQRPLRVESLEDRRMLAAFTVTTNANSGEGSLRFAISQANAAPGPDEISFDSDLTGAVSITSNLLITDDLTINGPGRDVLAIDANQASRIINVSSSGDAIDLTINGLTLRNGRTTGSGSTGVDRTFSGGAILFDSVGTLSISDSALINNQTTGDDADGGAISAFGDVILSRVTITGNSTTGQSSSGGAISVRSSDLTLTETEVSGNSVGPDSSGGGVSFAGGTLDVSGSSVSGNSSSLNGGGISAVNASVFLVNSTVSGNTSASLNASGGGVSLSSFRIFDLRNSTVTDNSVDGSFGGGGGLAIGQPSFAFPNPRVTVLDSIVAGNVSVQTPTNDLDLAAAVTSVLTLNGSLIGDTITTGIDASTGFGNLLNVDPMLAPLASNGGRTPTHALLPGSPAIDAGSVNFDPNLTNPPSNSDQRGAPYVRVFGGRVDIGAFESQPYVVDSLLDISDGDFSPGQFTLREAIEVANSTLGADAIVFADTLPGPGTLVELASTLPTITESLSIVAPGNRVGISAAVIGDPSVDGDGARVLTVDDGDPTSRIDVTLTNLGLFGGDPSDTLGGGAILSMEDLEVVDSLLVGNTVAVGDGGAINSNGGGNLVVTRTEINDNQAADDGGGLFVNGELLLQDSTVSVNSTTGAVFSAGGGLFLTGGDSEIRQSTISGNFTRGTFSDGGGVFSTEFLDINRSTITLNRTLGANSDGGGVFKSGGDTDLRGSILSRNSAVDAGDNFLADGAVALGAQFSLIGSDVNNAVTSGAANVVSNSLQLGPLVLNGGPTRTHQPLPGSSAIDAGNPTVSSGTDQRGAPFLRVFGSRIDIGAVEVQPDPLPGDYNDDGVVNAADYAVWRSQLGQSVALPNEDPTATPGQVTSEDYDVWLGNFGATRPAPTAQVSLVAPAAEPAAPAPADAAFAALASPSPILAPSPTTAEPTTATTGPEPDDTLLLLATATAGVESESTPPEFAALDDAFSEEQPAEAEDQAALLV